MSAKNAKPQTMLISNGDNDPHAYTPQSAATMVVALKIAVKLNWAGRLMGIIKPRRRGAAQRGWLDVKFYAFKDSGF